MIRRVILLLLAAGLLGGTASLAPAEPSLVAEFAGERLDYDVAFLFFGRAAIGRISLLPEREPGPDGRGGEGSGRYVAELSAETKGFVGWMNYKRHVYTSTLVPCEGGTRWCTEVFVKDLTDRGRREVTTSFISRGRGVMTWHVRRRGRVIEVGREPIEEDGRYDDMLAALFNLRAGRYGPVEKGRRYELDMLPVAGVRRFTLRVLDGDEEARVRQRFAMGEGGVVVAVRLPKAIFDAEGEVFVWFGDEMVPLSATVENYLGLGDVTGHLSRAVRPDGLAPVPVESVEQAREERRRDEALSDAIRRQTTR